MSFFCFFLRPMDERGELAPMGFERSYRGVGRLLDGWMGVISRRIESPSFPSARRRRRRGWEERGGYNSHRPSCVPNTINSIHCTASYYTTRIITSYLNALITNNNASPPPLHLPPNHHPRPPKHPIPPPPARNLPLK